MSANTADETAAWTEEQKPSGRYHVPSITEASISLGGFEARAIGTKGAFDWRWNIFHNTQGVRSLQSARGGGAMTEDGAKRVALAVLATAIYADSEK